MRCSLRALAVAAAAIFPCLQAVQACAQEGANPNPSVLPSKVVITYKEPPKSKPELEPIHARLRQKKVLEQLQQFLAPLKLKRNLEVMTAECGGNFYLPYKPESPVTICYEFVQLIETVVDDRKWGVVGSSVVTREMFTVGPFVLEALHNVALAVFDIQEIPVWGHAEFAADNVAAFLMLQFGTDVAMKTILGSAYFLDQLEKVTARNGLDYLADIRPTVKQRYYNLLCIAFGGDPVRFANFVPINRQELATDLSIDRANRCVWEYEPLRRAFVATILKPHVDPELQKQVLARKWLEGQ
jgi:Putative metallopeptidase